MAAQTPTIVGLDHVQVAMPPGEEPRARTFYGQVLGMPEVPKPAALADRGGVWFGCGAQQLHLGVEKAFAAQRKAHPALLVRDLGALRARVEAAGYQTVVDEALPGYARFYCADPFGNRLEFLEPANEDDERADERDGEIKARVRETFGRNAEAYVTSAGHAAGDDLTRLVELAAPRQSDRALDLSTGGGHAALALAPHVAWLTATDLTPDMLAAARRHFVRRGVANADFVIADAERLPFLDESFDLVSVRIAPHHYADPRRAMSEVARVLASGGRFLLIDNIAPEDVLLDQLVNEWERRRDPSHVRAHTVTEWQRMFASAGLRVTTLETGRKTHDFADWVARTQMAPEEVRALERDMLAAPVHAREHFAIAERDGHVASWTSEFVIVRAER